MTGEAVSWLFAAACFVAAGYLLARAVDAGRRYLGGDGEYERGYQDALRATAWLNYEDTPR